MSLEEHMAHIERRTRLDQPLKTNHLARKAQVNVLV